MSLSNYVTLRNTSNVEQQVLAGNTHDLVAPYQEIVLLEADAEHALRTYDFLEKINMNAIGREVRDDNTAPIWMANMSGNPDAPKKLSLGLHKNKMTGLKEETFTDNLLANPLPYTTRYNLATAPEKEHFRSDKIELTQPARRFQIMPYERKPVENRVARIVKAKIRDASAARRIIGHVIESRPPGAYEPDASWSLDEIRLWLFLADRKCILGDSEREIRRAADDEAAANKALVQAKLLGLKRVYFRSADPQYRLPTRTEFELASGRTETMQAIGVETEKAQAVVAAQLDAVEEEPAPKPAPKKRGRPRKTAK